MNSNHRELFLNRTRNLLGEAALERLREATITIAGCGGVGGATAITLARLGVGGFTLADPGTFDEPDINRQWGATVDTLGENKARVYERMLRAIDPDLRIEVFEDGVTQDNLEQVLAKGDLVVDCLDISVPLPLRLSVYRRTMALGRYCVSGPIFGFGTIVMFAEPGGVPLDRPVTDIVELASTTSKLPGGFRKHLFPDHLDAVEESIITHRVPSSAISPLFATAAICGEIVLILLRELHPHWRPPICLPRALVLEPLGPAYRIVELDDLFPERAR